MNLEHFKRYLSLIGSFLEYKIPQWENDSWDVKVTLNTVTKKVRSAKLTQIQLKQMEVDKTTDESISAINTEKPPEKLPSKFHDILQILWQKTSKEQEPLLSIWLKVPEEWSFKPFCKNVQNKGSKATYM